MLIGPKGHLHTYCTSTLSLDKNNILKLGFHSYPMEPITADLSFSSMKCICTDGDWKSCSDWLANDDKFMSKVWLLDSDYCQGIV